MKIKWYFKQNTSLGCNLWKKHQFEIELSTIDKRKKGATTTTTLCKIFEKMVATRLSYHLEKYNMLSDVQSGFRSGRSTIDQIMRLERDQQSQSQ